MLLLSQSCLEAFQLLLQLMTVACISHHGAICCMHSFVVCRRFGHRLKSFLKNSTFSKAKGKVHDAKSSGKGRQGCTSCQSQIPPRGWGQSVLKFGSTTINCALLSDREAEDLYVAIVKVNSYPSRLRTLRWQQVKCKLFINA